MNNIEAVEFKLKRRRQLVWVAGLFVVALCAGCAGWLLARLGVNLMEAL